MPRWNYERALVKCLSCLTHRVSRLTGALMIEQSRHVPLRSMPWDPDTATEEVDEIVADVLADLMECGSGLHVRSMAGAGMATAASTFAPPASFRRSHI